VRHYLAIDFLLVTIPVSILLPYGFFSLLLPIAAFFFGTRQYKDAGWKINGDQLLVRSRMFGRITILVKRQRIQSLQLRQNPLQRRKGLHAFSMLVASSLGGMSMSNATISIRLMNLLPQLLVRITIRRSSPYNQILCSERLPACFINIIAIILHLPGLRASISVKTENYTAIYTNIYSLNIRHI